VYLILLTAFIGILYYIISFYFVYRQLIRMASNYFGPPPMPVDDVDVLLEFDFPQTGTHRFSAFVTFLILYIDIYDRKQNRNCWEIELKARLDRDGYPKAKCFQNELLSMCFHPDHFLYTLKSKRSEIPNRCIYRTRL